MERDDKMTDEKPEVPAAVAEVVARGRAAQAAFADADQETVDDAVTALAWTIYEPARARELAERAVEATGLGKVTDKITKNQRKTFGTLRDLLRAKTVGIIEEIPEKGLVKYGKPVGLIAAITPATNPAATPVNKAMMAIKGRNAMIIAPSPAALGPTTRTVEMMRAELERAGHSPDLVQVLPPPISFSVAEALMQQCDLIVGTGAQDILGKAYRVGKPVIGVGAGNVPVIIDTSADLADAAEKICLSKCFDNSTSCSSENSVTILADVYEDAMAALEGVGGYRCTAEQMQAIKDKLWAKGHLDRDLIAKDADVFARNAGLPAEAEKARFFMVEDHGAEMDPYFADEKLSLVLTVYKAADFGAAIERVRAVLDIKGIGHSVGVHTADAEQPHRLARELKVVRVLVNQAHTFGTGGGFNNGLNFTLSMGCGTWANNSISENLSYRHFINITHVVNTIPEDKPAEEDLFGPYWERHGK